MWVCAINNSFITLRTRLNSLWCEWAKFMYEVKLVKEKVRARVRCPHYTICCFFFLVLFFLSRSRWEKKKSTNRRRDENAHYVRSEAKSEK